jgi:xanthine dehydrogenase accessory factor
MLKGNHGLGPGSAPAVIGLGPGFTAGIDCAFAVETLRGHDLGRVLDQGRTGEDTGSPGTLGGESSRRVLRAESEGIFFSNRQLGGSLHMGDEVGRVGGTTVRSLLDGTLRGLLRPGLQVSLGEKLGDVDPREGIDPFRVSDRALAIAGGVLEAVLRTVRIPRGGGR